MQAIYRRDKARMEKDKLKAEKLEKLFSNQTSIDLLVINNLFIIGLDRANHKIDDTRMLT